MAPPKSEPRKARNKQNGENAVEGAEGAAAEIDTSALDAVQLYEKADYAAPESAVLPKSDIVNLGSPDPEPVVVKAGETAAMHEAHVELGTKKDISERIALEEGPNGLPTDVISRGQQARAVATETGRVTFDEGSLGGSIAAPSVASVTLSDGQVLSAGDGGVRDSERPKSGQEKDDAKALEEREKSLQEAQDAKKADAEERAKA